MSELKNNNNLIKNKINLSIKNKILDIIKSTNNFIQDIINFNLKYIITHINVNNINIKYFDSKSNKLIYNFNLFSQIFEKLSEQFNPFKEENNEIILNENNYDNEINIIFNNLSNFSLEFENTIEQNFTEEHCINISINQSDENEVQNEIQNDTFKLKCWKEKYKSKLNYSVYNFNIVKLRTGLYYTKNLIEQIEHIFDEINYNQFIKIEKINHNDKYLNNKNILDIYNESLFKLQQINKESDLIIDEIFEDYLKIFKTKYTFDQDFLPFYYDLENILKFEHIDYIHKIDDINNATLEHIYSLLEYFNKTLFGQLSLRERYDYYNINESNFNRTYYEYYSLIDKNFRIYKNKINDLDKNYLFYNSLRKILRKLQINKRNFYKNNINNITKNYDYELLNISYNLGNKIYYYLNKEYEDYEFTFIYKYFELFYNNTNTYIQELVKRIENVEKIIKNDLNNIYGLFIYNYRMNISNFINYDFIKELQINYTNCMNYSYDKLDDKINEDKINFKKYNNYLELIELIKNCSNISSNLTEENTLNNNITDHHNYNCTNISDIEPVKFYNQTEHLLNCYEHNYYNYSVIIFENFNESYKKIMDDIFKNITDKINSNHLDENFINAYIEKKYYLNEFNMSHNELYIYYEDFEDIIFYLNMVKNEEYRNFLYNSLKQAYEISYVKFIDDYISNEITNNITIYINDKLDIFIECLKNKISYEYFYYIFLLNKTEEIGETTKNAFIYLHSNLKNKIEQTFNYIIEEDIFYYINIFFRENKDQLLNNFINYYNKDNNEYQINIFKLKLNLDDILFDKEFNKTLKNITNSLMSIIRDKAKSKINEIKNVKLKSLYDTIDDIQNKLIQILNSIPINEIPEDMNNLIELINNYTILVKNQNEFFKFNIDEEPFYLINNFTEYDLRPPLYLIKEFYNSIEELLINKIMNIVDNFPNYSSIIEEELDIDSKLEQLNDNYNNINRSLFEYKDILNKDFDKYFIQLVIYSFINGLKTYENECNDSFCKQFDLNNNQSFIKNDSTNNNNNTNYNEYINQNNNNSFNNNLFNIKEIKKKINKNINLNKEGEYFDSSKGALTYYDILYYLYQIHDTLLNFNQTYLNKEFKNINKTVTKYIIKLNSTYLLKFKRSFSIILTKFLTIITENNVQKLEQEVYKQYYKIESYIIKKSYEIRNEIDNYITKLNSTSNLIEMIDSLTNFRISNYYDIISNSIQSSFTHLKKNNLRNLDNDDISYENKREPFDYNFDNSKYILDSFLTIEKIVKNKDNKCYGYIQKYNFSLSVNLSNYSNSLLVKWLNNSFKWDKNYPIEFPIPIPLFPFLQSRIIIDLYAGIGLEFFPYDFRENKFCLHVHAYAKAISSVKFEVGIYYPGSTPSMEIALVVGINGVLVSGQVGMDLKIYLNLDLKTDLYYKYAAIQLSFYVLFKIKIEIELFKSRITFRFDFYIVNELLFGIYKEKHKISNRSLIK